jgi:hypothetical protein
MDLGLDVEAAAQFAMVFVISFICKHGTDAGHERESGQEQPLKGKRVADVRRGGDAGERHAVPVGGDVVLVPLFPRSVGLGLVRSPPRLARTEQLSRIRSGWPRRMGTSSAGRSCRRSPPRARPYASRTGPSA